MVECRCLQIEDLRRFMSTLSAEYDEESMKDLLAKVDADRDGKLTFPEFASFFAHLQFNPHKRGSIPSV